MENATKYKLAVWAAILMAILNLTIIGTMAYHRVSGDRYEEQIVLEEGESPLTGRYFKERLNFDEEQMDKYRTYGRQFKHNASKILESINNYKSQMENELQKDSPNMEFIAQMADSIGSGHSKLKMESANFYLALRKYTNSEQRGKLHNTFAPLFQEKSFKHGGEGKGKRHGMPDHN